MGSSTHVPLAALYRGHGTGPPSIAQSVRSSPTTGKAAELPLVRNGEGCTGTVPLVSGVAVRLQLSSTRSLQGGQVGWAGEGRASCEGVKPGGMSDLDCKRCTQEGLHVTLQAGRSCSAWLFVNGSLSATPGLTAWASQQRPRRWL